MGGKGGVNRGNRGKQGVLVGGNRNSDGEETVRILGWGVRNRARVRLRARLRDMIRVSLPSCCWYMVCITGA